MIEHISKTLEPTGRVDETGDPIFEMTDTYKVDLDCREPFVMLTMTNLQTNGDSV